MNESRNDSAYPSENSGCRKSFRKASLISAINPPSVGVLNNLTTATLGIGSINVKLEVHFDRSDEHCVLAVHLDRPLTEHRTQYLVPMNDELINMALHLPVALQLDWTGQEAWREIGAVHR